MALERLLSLPPDLEEVKRLAESSSPAALRLSKRLEMGNLVYENAMEYVDGAGLNLETSTLSCSTSVFEVGTPGVLSLNEVKSRIELGRWGLTIGDKVVCLEVTLQFSQIAAIKTTPY